MQRYVLAMNPLVIYGVPFLLFVLLFLPKWLSITPPKNVPPSPPKLPLLGNLHQLGLYPHRSLSALAQRHGPLMLLHIGRRRALIASSADTAREIMKTHDFIFSNRPKLSISDRLLYDGKDVSTAPYGEYWRQLRSICVLQLLSNKRVQSFRAVREEAVAFFLEKIRDDQCCSLSLPVNLGEMFASLTNDIICRVAFGKKYNAGDQDGKKFGKLLGELMKLLGTFNVGDYIPWLTWVNRINGIDARVEKVYKEFDQFLDGILEQHKRQSRNGDGSTVLGEDRKDLVDVLLEIQKDNAAGRAPALDEESIKALILNMFAAGTDTTYTVLEWAMSELLRHPRVMKKLQDEVRGISQAKTSINEKDIEKMQYLKAVTKETLRLYPPFPLLVPRESTQDVEVKGYHIAAGTIAFINAWAIGRDPALWEEPEEFRPERFLNSSIDFRGHDFQLIPFGAGRRGCPGITFAMATNELVLANLVHKFDWALPGDACVEDLNMTQCIGLTVHRKVPLLAVASTPTYKSGK
ncbi:hypothetical protein F2P56_019869 [Juglans regia]|uniref:Cytochrome P450 71A6-like n=2 Tax=Juglans regia TaxID=51240 RepID=A0A2I4E6D4_JUGRE|nr:cytochrome P450 71A6-like [Juglans regia]KAF5459965.1 hypothetical protein F2P56_019869 [Juglans regia]